MGQRHDAAAGTSHWQNGHHDAQAPGVRGPNPGRLGLEPACGTLKQGPAAAAAAGARERAAGHWHRDRDVATGTGATLANRRRIVFAGLCSQSELPPPAPSGGARPGMGLSPGTQSLCPSPRCGPGMREGRRHRRTLILRGVRLPPSLHPSEIRSAPAGVHYDHWGC